MTSRPVGADVSHDGVLVVDKPAGMTSHDVVAQVRRLAGTRKVGHAGTLDPMATGVLLIGVNRATRLLTYLVGADKSYDATVRLGEATVTDDAEGQPLPPDHRRSDPDALDWAIGALTPAAIRAAAAALTGEIDQVPSAVSAIKVGGVRSYARVRAGNDVALPARRVRVHRFHVGEPVVARGSNGPVVDVPITVDVSSGTYVRALARDLGAALAVGGHLTALRRTRVGAFGLDRAHALADLTAARALGGELPLLDMADVARLALPVRLVDPAQARELSYGRPVAPDPDGRHGPVAAIGQDGRLVAILADRAGLARPVGVFAPPM